MKFTPTTIAAILASSAHLIHAVPAPAPQAGTIICPPDGLANVAAAGTQDLIRAADNLNKKGGTCTTPPGEGACIRVACDNTSGIWMCNTDGHGADPKSARCIDVANFVHRGTQPTTLVGECGNGSGQALAPDGDWNVITGYANCGKPVTNAPDQQ